jgi:hypothetical protein
LPFAFIKNIIWKSSTKKKNQHMASVPIHMRTLAS